MILIISDRYDGSTCNVIDWLRYRGVDFQVLYENDFVEFVSSNLVGNLQSIQLETKKQAIDTNKITKYWYRRGEINRRFMPIDDELIAHSKQEYLIKEWSFLKAFLHLIVEQKEGIGNFAATYHTDKLKNLLLATKVGLQIPNTFISNKPDAMKEFIKKAPQNITKSIERDFNYRDNTMICSTFGTILVEDKHIEVMNNQGRGFPVLLQNYVSKAYELRIFYALDRMWAMAIFSQRDDQTAIDFRNYNHKKPNRMVPFNVPKDLANKIHAFMRLVNLNTGSIDIIVTPENEYVFLEVNPVGQFGFVSYECNYQLEKEIAEILLN